MPFLSSLRSHNRAAPHDPEEFRPVRHLAVQVFVALTLQRSLCILSRSNAVECSALAGFGVPRRVAPAPHPAAIDAI